MDKPLILVTNDDGIDAPGIEALAEAMDALGEFVIVAPSAPHSGISHAVTLHSILRINKIMPGGQYPAYACNGTPVDSVKLAIRKVLGKKPDLIVSGINHGSNSSINVIYSGTMAAAIEGALEGIPSIGFSLLDHGPDPDFKASVKIAYSIARNVLKTGLPKGICLNVNIPNVPIDEIIGIKVCRQADATWIEDFDTRTDPGGGTYHWMTGEFRNQDFEEDTDEWALKNNYVSVVPISYDMTAKTHLSAIQNMLVHEFV